MYRFYRSLGFVIFSLALSGCEWNSALYERYVDGGVTVCEGGCRYEGELTKEMCQTSGGTWVEAACLDYQVNEDEINVPNELEACEDAGGTWDVGQCRISNRNACENLGGTWEEYDYNILDLGQGNYIRRIIKDDKERFVCGAYAFILDDDQYNTIECSESDMRMFKEALEYRLCPIGTTCQAAYVPQIEHNGGNKKLAVCSSCPENNVMCRDSRKGFSCVNLDNDFNHCGSCGHRCEINEVCESGICQKTEKIEKCAEHEVSCETGEGNPPNCYDPASAQYCGMNSCDDPERFKCVAGESCFNVGTDEDGRLNYACKCVGTDQKTEFEVCGSGINRRCLQPFLDTRCGETCDTDGRECKGKTSCQKVGDDEYRCLCTDGRVTLNVNGEIECIDPKMDIRYCGLDEQAILDGETNACGASEECFEGTCKCIEGYIKCNKASDGTGGVCIRAENDPKYCGAKGLCNDANMNSENYKGGECDSTRECVNGRCVCNATKGLIECDGECIDPKAHPNYCGAKDSCKGDDAGENCSARVDAPVCINGRCDSSCPEGQEMCDGACVDTNTSVEYCGGCDKKGMCEKKFRDGFAQCVEGECHLLACKAGYDDCDGNASNGCETNVWANPDHCGVCGNACAKDESLKVSSAICEYGRCIVDSCYEGAKDCDDTFGNGCERNISTDVFNCGGCDQACKLECYKDDKDTADTARCLAKCEGGKCCATGDLKSNNINDFKCCSGYEVWKYDPEWWQLIGCTKPKRYGCFTPDEGEGLSSCWKKQ